MRSRMLKLTLELRSIESGELNGVNGNGRQIGESTIS